MKTRVCILATIVIVVVVLAALLLFGRGNAPQTTGAPKAQTTGSPKASSGANEPAVPATDDVNTKCIALCELALNEQGPGALEKGPCLSNDIAPGWVCDVAHEPRAEVDNDPANQCPAFKEGGASHFVEVDTGCNLIRAV